MTKNMTPTQRIKAYQYALEQIDWYEMPFMCDSLDNYMKKIGRRYYGETENIFPEFEMFRPDNDTFRWCEFNKSGNNIRRTILEFCIYIAKTEKK